MSRRSSLVLACLGAALLWPPGGRAHTPITTKILFNREVVGWSIKPRMTADIVTDALAMAWFRRKPQPGYVFSPPA